jgi:surfeit locus 1 family protein
MKIRLVPTLLILLVMAVTIRLGFWQRDRAHQKEALQAQIERYEAAAPQTVGVARLPLQDVEFHRVRATGTFMPDLVVYLDNRPYNEQPGFYVVMPLKLQGGGYVLVNRGWLPRNFAARTEIAPYDTPGGTVTVEGIARADATRVMELGASDTAPRDKIRQNLEIASYAAETGLPLQPFVIEQTGFAPALKDGLVRDWPQPATGVETNYGYMLQWWGMAAAALGFGLYAARRAATKPRVTDHSPRDA